ncbi:poly-gamma-glutamate hydrolase family protein [Kitasatospora sp. HPMI-4]|uniref:poly-gamma-glutamate hydrolase family protein n=1 Tax=Kitasatospora sp. HPMI-4 TaxID=3448443 RepID=UPI003F19399C
MILNRRTLITALAAAPVLSTTSGAVGSSPARAAGDVYASNTALYADIDLVEGVDYGRRYRRHPLDGVGSTGRSALARTTVIAPHGGGIEPGTSELCLAIAGYHPADLAPTPAAGPVHDYWMFEGLRSAGNAALHVTATHCDDTAARSLCGGSLNVLSLHGCRPSRAGLAPEARAVLVGGLNTTLRQYLMEEFAAVGIRAVTASGDEEIAGLSPANICNRTLLGMGAQLEISTELRAAMFAAGKNTTADRAAGTLPLFWSFVHAARTAIERVETGQRVL